ncbi:MAG: patatin-like phospholipase family protein [Bacteroidia bacterium]
MQYPVGIVLSGGGVRGFAHLGALKALNERAIFPSVISGVSAGAIIGALYADGYTPDEIFDLLNGLEVFKMLKIRAPRLGFLKPDGLKITLQKFLRAKSFEDLKIPLFISATNLSKANIEVFESGNLVDGIMASMALPIIIRPYEINGCLYVDGGLMNNLPVQPLLGKADKIIGVYVNPVKNLSDKFRIRNYADRIVHIGLRANILPSIEKCDLFIEPPGLMDYNLFKASASKKIFDIGYDYTSSLLDSQGF